MYRHTLAIMSLLLAAPPLQAADIPSNIAAAVASPERSAKDRERDARDKPAELLAFAGVKPGMKVADVFGGAEGVLSLSELKNERIFADFVHDRTLRGLLSEYEPRNRDCDHEQG